MTLANPIYLWSLLGLAIPIAIHFLSRKEGKVIKLGSIRHVQESSTQQFRGIRLNEILLLILRCVLILVLSLILSRLHFNQKNGKWILVEKGTEDNKNVQATIDSLEAQGYESHWLANSFPSITSSPDSMGLNYWSVIRELEKQSLEAAVVFSFMKAENFRGQPPAIPDNVKVIPVETRVQKFILESVRYGDSIFVRTGVSNSSLTSFENRKIKFTNDSKNVTSARQVKITLVSDKTRSQERRILLAAVKAIDRIVSTTFIILERDPAQFLTTETTDWIFWISHEKMPAVGVNILKWSPSISSNLIEQSKVNEWILTQPLTEENALAQNLTFTLASILTFDSALEKIAAVNDQRTLPESMAWASGEGGASPFSTASPRLPSLLIIFFALLFALERYVSYRKNQ